MRKVGLPAPGEEMMPGARVRSRGGPELPSAGRLARLSIIRLLGPGSSQELGPRGAGSEALVDQRGSSDPRFLEALRIGHRGFGEVQRLLQEGRNARVAPLDHGETIRPRGPEGRLSQSGGAAEA